MSISPVTAASNTVETTVAKAVQSGSELDFAQLLKETLEQEYQEKVISMTGAADMAATSSGGTGIQALMLSAAATGDIDQTQLAVFMLLMMMQHETDENSEMSMLMGMMSNLIGQLEGTSQSQLYTTTMNSDYDRSSLLTVEKEVFAGLPATQEVTRSAAQAVVPTQCWKAATPAVTGNEHSRTPEALREIIDQFDVESAERYRPFRNGVTYCNIFVWDVTSALGCEIPHYIDNVTGQPRQYPDVSGAWEMNANATYDWLATKGGNFGWREVSAQEAQAWANEGRPAVTAWKNVSGKPGHVQVVCPSQDGGYDPIRGVTVAQAGAKVTNYTHISSTFKQSDLKNVKYYVHD